MPWGSLKMGVSAFRRKKQESPFSSFFSGAAKATGLYSETLPDQQCCWFHSTMSFFVRHGMCVFVYAFDEAWVTVHFLSFSFLLLCHSVDSQTW